MSTAHCWWHEGPGDDVALIIHHEQGSGGGYGLFACLPCAQKLPLDHYGRDAQAAVAALEKRDRHRKHQAAQEASRG
ncbi:hypothetical protein ACIGW3_24905 [Streptomyces sp. NPDC053499]|uniref:hypothetical protein n=1 Tax=Streptomyces sp. NPDC053499 TaxID=3365707 RepID=UPI0037D35CBD